MQTIAVYIIVTVAVVAAGVMLYWHLTRPGECSQREGCTNCPLAEHCDKKTEDR